MSDQHSGPCTNGRPCHWCERARLSRVGVFFTDEEVAEAVAQSKQAGAPR